MSKRARKTPTATHELIRPRRGETPASRTQHIVYISGGKDSTACLLIALATVRRSQIRAVWCDTGHEHPETVDHIAYLADELKVPIVRLAADFTDRIAHKRAHIPERWGNAGVPEAQIERAVELLVPTGIPFLDLCMLKGRFPSANARFCTEELKVVPADRDLNEQLDLPGIEWCWQWLGQRHEESRARRHLAEWENRGHHAGVYRPIVRWPVSAVVEAHRFRGVKMNPLYLKGMGRIGCMPCILARKDEIRQWSMRWPEDVERIKEWEALVCAVSKRGYSSLMHKHRHGEQSAEDVFAEERIESIVEWSRTSHGGMQYDLVSAIDPPGCQSLYGLCE